MQKNGSPELKRELSWVVMSGGTGNEGLPVRESKMVWFTPAATD